MKTKTEVLDGLATTDWNAVENRITGYAIIQLRRRGYDDEIIYNFADKLQDLFAATIDPELEYKNEAK